MALKDTFGTGFSGGLGFKLPSSSQDLLQQARAPLSPLSAHGLMALLPFRAAMRPSQSEHFVEDEATRLDLAASFSEWWLETTDAVILNSPWLQRGTGRALRCFWILLQLFRWCALLWTEPKVRRKLVREPLMLLGVAGMLLCLGHVLWASMTTSRDRFATGLIFCVGLVACVACYSALEFATEQEETRMVYMDDVMFLFVALCHCNVHPLVFLLMPPLFIDQVTTPRTLQDGMVPHSTWTACLIVCALTTDFSKRVKAVSTGMLYGDGDANDPLNSPLAGRSGRKFCWLSAISTWMTWLLYMWSTAPGSRWREALLFLLALSLALASAGCGALSADVIMALLCHAPPTLVAMRVMNSEFNPIGDDITTLYMEYLTHCFEWLYFCEATHVLATQTLIQAGCHPAVCAAGFLVLLAQVLVETIWWDDQIEQATSLWSLIMPLGGHSKIKTHLKRAAS